MTNEPWDRLRLAELEAEVERLKELLQSADDECGTIEAENLRLKDHIAELEKQLQIIYEA